MTHRRPTGHQLGVKIGCFVFPFTTASCVSSRSPNVASGKSTVACMSEYAGPLPSPLRPMSAAGGEGTWWKSEAALVFMHDFGGCARAGEEPGIELCELGHQRAADDHPVAPRSMPLG